MYVWIHLLSTSRLYGQRWAWMRMTILNASQMLRVHCVYTSGIIAVLFMGYWRGSVAGKKVWTMQSVAGQDSSSFSLRRERVLLCEQLFATAFRWINKWICVSAIVQTDKCDLRTNLNSFFIYRVPVSVQNKRPKDWFFFFKDIRFRE